MIKKFIVPLFVCITLLSCKNDDDSDNGAGTLNLEFTNIIASESVVISDKINYTNKSNETYTISDLKYIISNIVLIKTDGSEFVYPKDESYFLINEKDSNSKKLTLQNIEGAEYSKIKFGFGVDQSKYPLEGANFVPTAEENDMIWSWAAGFKFLVFEGTYTPEGGETDNYLIHVGSHGEKLDNYKEISIDLSQNLSIKNQATSSVTIKADIAKILDGKNTHSLQAKNSIQIDPDNAPKIAENFAGSFSVTKVSN